MFDAFKVSILTKRIKAAVAPTESLAKTSTYVYAQLIEKYCDELLSIVIASAPIVEKHAGAIATAIVALEPLYKELKSSVLLKDIIESLNKDVQTITEQYEPALESHLSDIKEAMKIKE